MKKLHVLAYCGIIERGKEVWSSKVVDMLGKFSETWAQMGMEFKQGDFLHWYPEVMRQRSEYIIQEGDVSRVGRGLVEGRRHSMAKGKGRAPSNNNDKEEEDEEEDGSGEDGDGDLEKQSPIKLILPGSLHALGPLLRDFEDTALALKAKVQQLVET